MTQIKWYFNSKSIILINFGHAKKIHKHIYKFKKNNFPSQIFRRTGPNRPVELWMQQHLMQHFLTESLGCSFL